jgi:hypothetical protein
MFLTISVDNTGWKSPETPEENPNFATKTKLKPNTNLKKQPLKPQSPSLFPVFSSKFNLALEMTTGEAGNRSGLDLGVDRIEELKEIGVRSTSWSGREAESLVRVLFWQLMGMRSRVALMLAQQILQLQLASFRQPGK